MKLAEQLREISKNNKKPNRALLVDREITNIENMLVEIAKTGVFNYRASGVQFPYEVKKYFTDNGIKVSVFKEFDSYSGCDKVPTGVVDFNWE